MSGLEDKVPPLVEALALITTLRKDWTCNACTARSAVSLDCLPTLKTGNNRICLLLPSGDCGLLRVADAERAQATSESSLPDSAVISV